MMAAACYASVFIYKEEDGMARKILFFDIDDTLLVGRTHAVPESAKKALCEARKNGHLLFINTGRCKSFTPPVLFDLPFDGFCYACGAHIEYEGRTLFQEFVTKEEIRFIGEGLIESGLQGIFQGPELCYFSEPAFLEVSRLKGLPEDHHPDNAFAGQDCYPNLARHCNNAYMTDYRAPLHLFYEEEMEVNKLVSFWIKEEAHDKFLSLMAGKPYQYIENKNGFTEILPLPYTKATCMDYLLDYFKIDQKDCYVFGDSPNDLPMLTHVGTSIAMGNSYESVKEVSDYVTTDIEDNGILNALKHFGII